MILKIEDEIDLDKIADSGQCFRWKKIDEESYVIPAFGRYITASMVRDGLELSCTAEEYTEIWKDYFDMDTSYSGIRRSIDPDDNFLTASGEAGKGIRILRQDPFETLISFIVSQRKNIPAIMTSVEKMCRTFGKNIGECNGEAVYSFPTPEELSGFVCKKNGTATGGQCSYDLAGVDGCGLGYRVSYIQDTARHIAMNAGAIDKMRELSDDDLLQELMTYKGVGIKVASCTMLFGYHRVNSFPIDVWIKRALEEHYSDGFDFERYYPYNGIMQQYIFAYYRWMQK